MLQIALEITLCLLIAALIGFVLGFIVAKATTKKSDIQKPKKEKKKKIEKVKEKLVEEKPVIEKTIEAQIDTLVEAVSEKSTDTQKPEILDAPKMNKKDALTQIKGIGPKVEEQLNAAGIYHFEQIAQWNEENIQWLEEHTSFAHRAKKDLWVNQAKVLI